MPDFYGFHDNTAGADLLALVEVKPVQYHERQAWRALVNEHHYLGFNGTAGECLFHAASINGKWVALLSWAGAAYQVGCREAWLGWDDFAKAKRLRFVVNNTRFLILPSVSIKNLASKVLSLSVKRLSSDWQCFYNHPIWLAETFVDPQRFAGTCYKAAGWQQVGKTAGFSRLTVERGFYEHSGKPKLYFAKPLIANLCERISTPMFEDSGKEYFAVDISKYPIEGKGGLMEVLSTVKDPRQKRGMRHSCKGVLAVSASAMLSGARGFNSIAQYGRELSPKLLVKMNCKRPPSTTTIRRVLTQVDADEFDCKLCAWIVKANGDLRSKGLAIDGKTIRRSFDGEDKPIHLLSALLHHEKVTIKQKAIGEKKNEISEFKNLLAPLDIKGMLITADAMHCQEEHSRFIVMEKEADFLWTVKANQPTLLALLTGYLSQPGCLQTQTCQLSLKGHGRLDRYDCTTKTWPVEMAKQHSFPYIKQVAKVTREWSKLDGTEFKSEQRYLITSAGYLNPDELLRANIDHWAIENSSHYVRDETFGEDRCRVRTKSGVQNLATLRNLSIAMIRLGGGSNVAEGLRFFSWGNKTRVTRALGIR